MKKNAVALSRKRRAFSVLDLMILPGLLYLIANNYIPMGGLFIAFKKINYGKGLFRSPWVGLDNFYYLFKTQDAWIITRNTLLYNFAFIICGTVLGVSVAILLNEILSQHCKKLYQTVILLPQLLSMVVVSYLAYAFLSSEYGLINNSILKPLGLPAVSWYEDKSKWPFILIFIHSWKTIGYVTLLYLSSIVSIEKTLYESAEIDGCSKWAQIRFITLPLVRPTAITIIMLWVGKIFYSDFGLFYQVPMDSGLLYDVTSTIDTYVYRGLVKMSDLGKSSAASFYQSIVGFLCVFGCNMLVRRFDAENALF